MSNPTSNFGWQMPTNTDLVTDLPADFEVFGQGVDTSMADLKGGTTGQILSKTSNTDMDFTWINNDQGDITAVNVTSPITGGGTSGAVTVGIQSASTSQSGAVQLSDSTSSTSTVLAATANAVKSAYDLANSKGVGTITGVTAGTGITGGGTSGAVTVTFDQANYGGGQYAAGKNKIINGNFGVWQRGTSFSSTGYTADRWYASINGTTTVAQETTIVPSGATNSLKWTTGAGSSWADMAYALEAADVNFLGGKTITVSTQIRAQASFVGNVYLRIQTNTTANTQTGGSWTTVVTTDQTPSTSAFTTYSATYAVPAGTKGLRVFITVAAGQASGTGLYIGNTMMEVGSTATPFQTATGTIQGELAACQRYYYRFTPSAAANRYGTGFCDSTTIAEIYTNFPVQMRIRPTALEQSGTAADYSVRTPASGTVVCSAVPSYGNASEWGSTTNFTVASGLTAGNGTLGRAVNTSAYLGWSAEL